jgi:hypothetical protein
MVMKMKCHTSLSNLAAFVEGEEYFIVAETTEGFTLVNKQGKTHFLSKNDQSASYYGHWLQLETN